MAGQEGEERALQANRIAGKANKSGFGFSLDVPGGYRDAWICMAKPRREQPLVQPTTSNVWSRRNTLGFQLEREAQHFVALLSYQNVYIN